ncbi:hypothetical protein HAX54_014719 [Datura stramonium]|uniref:Uncharacterized protein n=1 Tax=Datura stramonium TaxID=4076 RepID=A0ABS8RYW7_DATST|nr:hypothetical protein [Datura stramonium]
MDKETKHSWSCFINYLKENLQLGAREGLTVIADMQKFEGVLGTFELIGIKTRRERRGENNYGDVLGKDTFLKDYSHFIQPISNIKIWPETNNPRIEPLEPKPMPRIPPRNRRKRKDESRKKYEKMFK